MGNVWSRPTSHTGGEGWENPTWAYDGNVSTAATSRPPGTGWGNWLNLHPDEPIYCDKVKWKMNIGPGFTNGSIEVQVEVDGSWIYVYDEYCTIHTPTWWEESFAGGVLTAIRFRNEGAYFGNPRMDLYDDWFWELPPPPPFIKFIGTAAGGDSTRHLVNEGDQAGETRTGWLKIGITDVGNQVADGDYYVPIYSLS